MFITFLPFISIFSLLFIFFHWSLLSVFNFSLFYFIIIISKILFSLSPLRWPKSYLFLMVSMMATIFFSNFLSIFSYIFPSSSQISLVLFMSLFFWVSINFFSLFNSFSGFLSHLTPMGGPLPLSFFLVLIELVSSAIRPITLTVRLVANILSGHLLMTLLFSLVSLSNYSLAPLYAGLTCVEVFVSFIQSYIFVVLLSLYFSEV